MLVKVRTDAAQPFGPLYLFSTDEKEMSQFSWAPKTPYVDFIHFYSYSTAGYFGNNVVLCCTCPECDFFVH